MPPSKPTRAREVPARAREVPTRVREVTVTELDQHASRVLGRVTEGEIAVISKHRRPVAMLLSLLDAVTMLPPEIVMAGALRELAEEFEARERLRWISKLEHGRWHADVLDR